MSPTASICCWPTHRNLRPAHGGAAGQSGAASNLAANARRLVEERYDWAAIGQQFVDLVEEAVKERIQRGQL